MKSLQVSLAKPASGFGLPLADILSLPLTVGAGLLWMSLIALLHPIRTMDGLGFAVSSFGLLLFTLGITSVAYGIAQLVAKIMDRRK